jgi:hypothetical protein
VPAWADRPSAPGSNAVGPVLCGSGRGLLLISWPAPQCDLLAIGGYDIVNELIGLIMCFDLAGSKYARSTSRLRLGLGGFTELERNGWSELVGGVGEMLA